MSGTRIEEWGSRAQLERGLGKRPQTLPLGHSLLRAAARNGIIQKCGRKRLQEPGAEQRERGDGNWLGRWQQSQFRQTAEGLPGVPGTKPGWSANYRLLRTLSWLAQPSEERQASCVLRNFRQQSSLLGLEGNLGRVHSGLSFLHPPTLSVPQQGHP